MAQPIQVVYSLSASVTTALVNAQNTVAANTAFTLATTIVDANQRRLLLTMTGNETANVFKIVGTNQAGIPITEFVQGVNNSTATTNMDFRTVTAFTASANTAGTTSLGTFGTGSTPWYIMNQNADPVNIGISGVVTSVSTAVTWGAQYTFDDPNNLPSGVGTAAAFNHPVLVNLTNSLDSPLAYPVMATRFIITAGTGNLRGTIIQAGAASP